LDLQIRKESRAAAIATPAMRPTTMPAICGHVGDDGLSASTVTGECVVKFDSVDISTTYVAVVTGFIELFNVVAAEVGSFGSAM